MNDIQELLASHFQVLAVAVAMSIVTAWIAYCFGFFRLPKEESSPYRLSFLSTLGAFLVFLTIELFLVPLLSISWMAYEMGHWPTNEQLRHLDPATEGWVNMFAIFITAIGILTYLFLLSPETRQVVWGEKGLESLRRTLYDFFLGCCTWWMSYPIVLACGQIIAIILLSEYPGPRVDQIAVKHLKTSISYPILFWSMVISIVTIVPIIEEILFRGFLQSWLKQTLGRGFAIYLTAIIFALFHFSTLQGAENIELLVSLFVLACFLGFLYERQRSLWAPIGLHAFFNGMSILLIMITD
jgi:membrane protease YdiL (CAAX protease family)